MGSRPGERQPISALGNPARRHRFKPRGRTAGINTVYLDASGGTGLPTQGNNHGEFEPGAHYHEIRWLPSFQISKNADVRLRIH